MKPVSARFWGMCVGWLAAGFPAALWAQDSLQPVAEPVFLNVPIQKVEWNDTLVQLMVDDPALELQGCDTFAQIRFWRQVMTLTPDSSLLNVAGTRQLLETVHTENWLDHSDTWKDNYRDSLRKYHCLPKDARIFLTSGKSDFYAFERAFPGIDRAIDIFMAQETDPWYAQAILLIESPGKLEKSPAGALGSFQLMRHVALRFGLKVNRTVDERKDFNKSAVAASKLLKTICIPETRRMLARRNIEFCEDDLWFRLLVLHVYHAGAANVGGAMTKLAPKEGNLDLIRDLWNTEYGRFRNASQNYSQVAIASLLEMRDRVSQGSQEVCPHDVDADFLSNASSSLEE